MKYNTSAEFPDVVYDFKLFSLTQYTAVRINMKTFKKGNSK